MAQNVVQSILSKTQQLLVNCIPVRLAGLESLAGAVPGVVRLLELVFISGVLGQEPPLPLVWARSKMGRSFFNVVTSRVSQAGAVFAELGVGTRMGFLAGEFVIADVADLLDGDGLDPLDGDEVVPLNGDGVDLLDGDGANSLDGTGVVPLDGDGADLLDGDGVGSLDGDGTDLLDGDGAVPLERDGVDLLDGDGAVPLAGDGAVLLAGVVPLDGDGADLLDGDGVGSLDGDGAVPLDRDGVVFLEGERGVLPGLGLLGDLVSSFIGLLGARLC